MMKADAHGTATQTYAETKERARLREEWKLWNHERRHYLQYHQVLYLETQEREPADDEDYDDDNNDNDPQHLKDIDHG